MGTQLIHTEAQTLAPTFHFLKISYLVIFGYAGSSLLLGLFSSYGEWASHRGGFSCCGVQALGRGGFSSCGMWAL